MKSKIIILPTIWLSKTIYLFTKIFKLGSGTSLPGLFIENYIPWVLTYFDSKFADIIFITGTNGKTTTRALLTHTYESNGVKVISNRGGANIFRGIASSLVLSTSLLGKPNAETLILEVEEATLPKLTTYIRPNKIIFTNIFRDQLDAYGEIDSTLRFFKEAIANTKNFKNLEIIINRDDHKLLTIIPENYPVILFGLDDINNRPQFEKSDKLSIEKTASLITAKNIRDNADGSISFEVNAEDNILKTHTHLPGYYNIYNILAALAISFPKFGTKAIKSVSTFKPVFGRGEVVKINQTNLHLFLVKNPAGFDEVLNYIHNINIEKEINMSFLINDNIADGKDVSWLWDINLEKFVQSQKLSRIKTGGMRGLDMLLRLEYSGASVKMSDNYAKIDDLIETVSQEDKDYYVLCTYTALLETRKILEKYTKITNITDSGN